MAIYYLVFGNGDPSANTGLAPTFTVFQNSSGGATTSPSISEISSTGIYTFSYTASGSINFVADGATTGLASPDRYIVGSLDEGDSISGVAFGDLTSPIGDDSTNPDTLFGYVRRVKEWLEGQSTYTKSSGAYVVKETTGATTLSSQTILDNGTTVDKT